MIEAPRQEAVNIVLNHLCAQTGHDGIEGMARPGDTQQHGWRIVRR
jgi:hypothetical protein